MNPKYISSWTVYTGGLEEALEEGLKSGEIQDNDVVWGGPSGDYVVAGDPAELDEEYADYVDRGMVSEFLHDEDED